MVMVKSSMGVQDGEGFGPDDVKLREEAFIHGEIQNEIAVASKQASKQATQQQQQSNTATGTGTAVVAAVGSLNVPGPLMFT
ncbi:hypothetical protein M0802_010286 [Mischocyttarus mexicanus]|nr:hypothetical protein M0802_010286 [Mischocyttarus mexicanus]